MSGRFKLILALMLALILLSGLGIAAMAEETEDAPANTDTAPAEESAAALPPEYKLAAQSSRFNLYVREDTLAIILESRANGSLLCSTVQNPDDFKDQAAWKGFYQSGIVMEFIEDVKSTNTQADFINMEAVVSVEYLENGFSADVLFPAYGVGYSAVVTLDESCLTVTIPQDKIINGETDGHRYTVSTFTLYPFLGYSVLGQDEGYMIIPDGQGALIELKDNEKRFSSPFDRPVYGTNIGIEDTVNSRWTVGSEPVIMPVFGMVHTAKQIGFLGVIEQGDNAARIRAYPNGANNLNFDWVSAKYTYRMVYKQPTGPSSGAVDMLTEDTRRFDIVQHFLLADGEDATYAGLACAWRDYMEEKGFFAHADTERPFDVEVDFLGVERENDVLGKTDVVMTSFQQAGEILESMKTDGVDHASVVFRGWQSNGLTGGVPTSYSPAGSLGGGGGLEALNRKCTGLGMGFSLEADFLSLNTETHPTLTYSAFKKITSQTWSRPTFGPVYATMYYLAPERSKAVAGDTLNAMSSAGIPGVQLTGITQLMADYYYQNHYQESGKLAQAYRDIAALAAKDFSVTLKSANAYLWPYAGALNDLPVTGSDYAYVSRDVPLLAIALSGKMPAYLEYVNFQANAHKFFLRLAEQGTRPCFLLTMEDPIKLQNTNSSDIYSARWDLYRVTLAMWYSQLKELHRDIDGASIVAHDMAGDITRVTWSNGVKVYLNYGETAGEMDGVALEPMTWKAVN
ncbi:MAG: hypothetical protein IKP22_04830 [Clostridia bacterium]|nr:hypothetical protein [Clostridia bacterium]